MTNNNKVEWDEEEKNIVELVPEMELPDCIKNPPRHHWIDMESDTFLICYLCGLMKEKTK